MNDINNGAEPVTPKLDDQGNPIPTETPAPASSGGSDEKFDDEGNLIVKDNGSDPLDAIEDETVRARAKKDRAIFQRKFSKGEIDDDGNPIVKETPPANPDKPVAPAEPASPAATKDDLKLMTLNSARKIVPSEVADVWDDLKAIPLGGFDEMDADSIATNMIKRYNLYRQDNPVDPENPAAPLSTSPRVPAGGAGNKTPASNGEGKQLPGYKEPAQPEDWYPPAPGEEQK